MKIRAITALRILNIILLTLVAVGSARAMHTYGLTAWIQKQFSQDNVTTEAAPTLVLALSVDCVYCTANMPFYRALLASRVRNEFNVVATFPQSKEIAREYLKVHGLVVDEIQSASLESMGVFATPTLRIVDSQGAIFREWVGLQRAGDAQTTIAKSLAVDTVFPAAAHAETLRGRFEQTLHVKTIGIQQYLNWSRSTANTFILDVRDQGEFEQSHVEGAVNIPLEQLSRLAELQFTPDDKIALFCDHPEACTRDSSSDYSVSPCFVGGSILLSKGYKDVRVLVASLPTLREQGIRIIENDPKN